MLQLSGYGYPVIVVDLVPLPTGVVDKDGVFRGGARHYDFCKRPTVCMCLKLSSIPIKAPETVLGEKYYRKHCWAGIVVGAMLKQRV